VVDLSAAVLPLNVLADWQKPWMHRIRSGGLTPFTAGDMILMAEPAGQLLYESEEWHNDTKGDVAATHGRRDSKGRKTVDSVRCSGN